MVVTYGAPALNRAAAMDSDLESRFATFVGTHRERARRLCFRLVGDEAAAEDVAQEAFAKAYAALGGFRGEARLETWFYRILVRQAYSYRRWRSVRHVTAGVFSGDEPDPRPDASGDPALRQRIGAALETLTRSQRDAFVLVHLEGFTVAEASRILDKAEGTIKSHLHRALRGLRAELEDVWTEDKG